VREIVAYARARFVTIGRRSRCRGIPRRPSPPIRLGNRATPFCLDLLGVDQNILNPDDATIQFARTFSPK